MSRSRRASGKRTVKQVDARVTEVSNKLDTLGSEFAGFANAAANDILKLNHLIYALLDKDDLITKIQCPHCKKEVIRPELEGIEQSEQCPHCGKGLYGESEQTTLDVLGEEE